MNLPFNKLIRKFSDQGDIISLEDFHEKLDKLILKMKEEHEKSKEAEYSHQEEYEEKLSKLDFSGSKKAVEESRHQFVKSLELDVQIEFLMNIKKISNQIPKGSFKTTKKQGKFNQIASQIFDRKKLESQYSRRMILKQFKKFLPPSLEDPTLDIVLAEKGQNDEIERILQEVKDGNVDNGTIENEIEKIIEEVRSKKRENEDI